MSVFTTGLAGIADVKTKIRLFQKKGGNSQRSKKKKTYLLGGRVPL